jgi:hypothetical protein
MRARQSRSCHAAAALRHLAMLLMLPVLLLAAYLPPDRRRQAPTLLA